MLGMMRFGNYRSPVLLEAAGDLLSAGYNHDAKRLAARAYLKASMEVEDADAKQAYRKMAEAALSMQTRKPRGHAELTLRELEATFAKELREADQWYQQVADDERRWINEGIDVDQAFSDKYYQEPTVGAESSTVRPSRLWLVMVVAAAMAGVVILFLVDRWRRYSGQPGKSSMESTF